MWRQCYNQQIIYDLKDIIHDSRACCVYYIYCSKCVPDSSLCVSSKQIMSLSARTSSENDDVSIQDLTINTFLTCNLLLKTSYYNINHPLTNIMLTLTEISESIQPVSFQTRSAPISLIRCDSRVSLSGVVTVRSNPLGSQYIPLS